MIRKPHHTFCTIWPPGGVGGRAVAAEHGLLGDAEPRDAPRVPGGGAARAAAALVPADGAAGRCVPGLLPRLPLLQPDQSDAPGKRHVSARALNLRSSDSLRKGVFTLGDARSFS